ncbi:hypothetical protein [Streptomyces bauhiniae]|uniref:Uncharacterized protein n=1 Tax=Streptomyces bauhiniae TaxID=2340725 RepID=A0A7K3QR04_9ACTN|nr:hypothetical protein [Streptomyces bauhiniae]NEB92285.1 hypothetical protein [Streptomyces bauhiniae]
MTDENPTRSLARAHLSQLIDLFGTDGCLRISTAWPHVVGGSTSDADLDCDKPGNDERT